MIGKRSTIWVHTQGSSSIAINMVSARQIAITATRCTGVNVSNGFVLDLESHYNHLGTSHMVSIARLGFLAKQ